MVRMYPSMDLLDWILEIRSAINLGKRIHLRATRIELELSIHDSCPLSLNQWWTKVFLSGGGNSKPERFLWPGRCFPGRSGFRSDLRMSDVVVRMLLLLRAGEVMWDTLKLFTGKSYLNKPILVFFFLAKVSQVIFSEGSKGREWSKSLLKVALIDRFGS